MTYVLEVAVVDQLHQQEYVEEELSLWLLHDLLDSRVGAVQFSFNILILLERSGLAWEIKSGIQVWQVVGDDEHGIAQFVQFAQLFELFG